MNIDISEYKLMRPESIENVEGIEKFYDIEVEDDHTFFLMCDNDMILSHNCDGNHIASLLVNFFYRYWPKLFDMNMIYKVETPIVVAHKKGSKIKSLFYSQSEYQSWLKRVNESNWEVKYKKGLAALVDDEYNEIINNPRLVRIDATSKSEKYLDIWFGKDSDLRKLEMLK
jgi:DNA gyrase/topoisomerase IV subunit B